MPSLPLFLCICTLHLPPQHFTGQWLGVRGLSRLVAGAEWEERHVSETGLHTSVLPSLLGWTQVCLWPVLPSCRHPVLLRRQSS